MKLPREIPEAEKRMREFPCGTCGAAPTQLCYTKGGRPAQKSHADRFWKATEAGRLPIADVAPW